MKKKPHKVTPRPKPKVPQPPLPPQKKKPVKEAASAPKPAEIPQDDPSSHGRQPIDFYIERYGKIQIIDNIGFVFSNGRWVSVDVDGFTYTQREIFAGDPNFITM